jgi:hypothetical protein
MTVLSLFAFKGLDGHWYGYNIPEFDVAYVIVVLVLGIASAIYFRKK